MKEHSQLTPHNIPICRSILLVCFDYDSCCPAKSGDGSISCQSVSTSEVGVRIEDDRWGIRDYRDGTRKILMVFLFVNHKDGDLLRQFPMTSDRRFPIGHGLCKLASAPSPVLRLHPFISIHQISSLFITSNDTRNCGDPSSIFSATWNMPELARLHNIPGSP
jgi:hypothetical protein